jgi:hypothetical protein
MSVRGWATLGVVFIAFEVYLYTRWIAAGNATPNSGGARLAPGWMKAAVYGHIAIGIVALIWCVWWFVIRPWKEGRRVTSDGLLMLACMTAFWGDLAANYFHYWVVYTTVWPNLGSWYNFIPGWQTPRGQLQAEATVFFLPMYAACMFGFTSIACAAMRKVRARNPAVPWWRLLLLSWLILGLIDLLLECIWVRLGLFVYPSTISWLTLFKGHYYQFPVYESITWGLGWAVLSCVRFFRNEHDETIVERGVGRLRRSPRATVALRFLALAAAANLNLLAYNIETSLISTRASHWPADFTSRPYYTSGLCGPGARYACPAAATPPMVTGR